MKTEHKENQGQDLKYPFEDSTLGIEVRVEDLLHRLTLDEKISLLSGVESWMTKPIERLGVKSFKMSDGPHGVAPHSSGGKACTYFPTSICMAATWNPSLLHQFGIAIAEEVRDIGFHMLLGPGVNIDRSPLNGRTFEYFTEDPYLNKKLSVEIVKGIQSQRIAACVKHFVANNQETRRYSMSSEVGMRALHEIYFPAFEACVKEGGAWSIMACYNKVNGIYGCAHEHLLRDTLMDKWNFKGFVVSDWGATKPVHDPAKLMRAGLSLEMPKGYRYRPKRLKRLLRNGKIAVETLDGNIRRLLRVMFLVGLFDDEGTLPRGSRNTPEHQAVARKIAEQGAVLLKNEGNIMPICASDSKLVRLFVAGSNAAKKMAMGGGSSQVKAPFEVTPIEGLEKVGAGKITVVSSPSEADVSIIFTGLDHERGNDAENRDRKSLGLPVDQVELIRTTAEQNPRVIVVLVNGSPISMQPWIDEVPGIIEAWYGGMFSGEVIASILLGIINPSGKLPLTFPEQLADSPAHAGSKRTYPGIVKIPWLNEKVHYDEGVLVGYRYFDAKDIKPAFPFGHGLSYTTFTYSDLSTAWETSTNQLIITCKITNAGKVPGSEVVQVYVHNEIDDGITRPPKELKGFTRVALNAGEARVLSFPINKESISYFDPVENKWKVPSTGNCTILIGSSSRDIRLRTDAIPVVKFTMEP
ncbi:MAG: beta-glucosidase family protein [Promethearchaeota archaeon]